MSWKRWGICKIKYNVLLRGKILRASQIMFWWSVENWSVYFFVCVLHHQFSCGLVFFFFFLREFRVICRKLQIWGLPMWSPFPAPVSYPVEAFHCFVHQTTTHMPLQPPHLHGKDPVAGNPLRDNHKCSRRNELLVPSDSESYCLSGVERESGLILIISLKWKKQINTAPAFN